MYKGTGGIITKPINIDVATEGIVLDRGKVAKPPQEIVSIAADLLTIEQFQIARIINDLEVFKLAIPTTEAILNALWTIESRASLEPSNPASVRQCIRRMGIADLVYSEDGGTKVVAGNSTGSYVTRVLAHRLTHFGRECLTKTAQYLGLGIRV